ncbi:MAG TPA: hypothetical protein VIM65_01795 [Cyclobacteriaceae bacterium]
MLKPLKIFFTLIVTVPSLCAGQDSQHKTLLLDSAVQHAYGIYSSSIGGNSHLLNGVEYRDYEIHNYDIGHPYYISDDWEYGTITYDHQIFRNVDMMYNIVRDKVIIDHPQGHFKLELIDEHLASFTLQGHHFVKLIKDSTTDIRTGYYDLLYDGKTKVYAKRRKEIQENLTGRTIIKEFNERDIFYIYKNGTYFTVRSKSAVLKVFAERKTMLRKHLSKLKIRFKKNKDFALVESAKFYDESEKL